MTGHRPNSVPPPWSKRILWGLFVLCAALVLVDIPALVLHWRYEEHPWEVLPMLYPLWGFVGISVLILASKGLRRLVMRPENYYEGGDAEAWDADAWDADAQAAGVANAKAADTDADPADARAADTDTADADTADTDPATADADHPREGQNRV